MMGDRLTVGQRTLTPPVLVRIQVPQPFVFLRCSGVEFCLILSNSSPEAIYSTMNFFIGTAVGGLDTITEGSFEV